MSSLLACVTTHRELVENLVLRDIKARYKQSVLGYAWAVFNPLVFSLTYTLVGKFILRQQTGLPFPLFAYFGVLFWNIFGTGIASATESLIAHLGLITKVYFPREVLPISAVVSKLFDFVFGLFGVIPFLLVYQIMPSWGFFLALPIVLILCLFTAGMGMLCATANLFYRDVRYLVMISTNILGFLWPNMYTLEQIPERFRPFYLLNPVATCIEAARRLTFPQVGSMDALWPFVGISAALSVSVFCLGYAVFKRYEPYFAEAI
ncbi:MAG: ABC transporter permease [Cytophagales bacterium]|nr:ABC transporter permease [Armatimonadota bacterium]